MTYNYKYPRPSVTADAVVFSQEADEWLVLLIERKNDPHKGCWALPGGFVDENEDLKDAAIRELKEETDVDGVALSQVGAYGTPGRDPRGHVISVAFYGVSKKSDHSPIAKDDAKKVRWFSLEKLPELAFDHAVIIEDAKKLKEN